MPCSREGAILACLAAGVGGGGAWVGDVPGSEQVPGGDPPPGWPLLHSVCILLQCILVLDILSN